jgi:RimJ/RimL family protein N-acetyltransferase
MFPDIFRDDVFRLETRRLWLRWPKPTDAAEIALQADDWQVARHTAHLPHPYAPDDADRFIRFARARNASGAGLDLVVELKTGRRDLIGGIGAISARGGMEIGYWLGQPYWGQGLASEAIRALTEALFLVTSAGRLNARLLPANARSRAVLARSGFRSAGDTVAEGRHAGRPAELYALPRAAWAAERRLRDGAETLTACTRENVNP